MLGGCVMDPKDLCRFFRCRMLSLVMLKMDFARNVAFYRRVINSCPHVSVQGRATGKKRPHV